MHSRGVSLSQNISIRVGKRPFPCQRQKSIRVGQPVNLTYIGRAIPFTPRWLVLRVGYSQLKTVKATKLTPSPNL